MQFTVNFPGPTCIVKGALKEFEMGLERAVRTFEKLDWYFSVVIGPTISCTEIMHLASNCIRMATFRLQAQKWPKYNLYSYASSVYSTNHVESDFSSSGLGHFNM